tara:strand:+ start:55519 stop:55674 length:156 start_codon:yes stop_codon:yes gene_type:complete
MAIPEHFADDVIKFVCFLESGGRFNDIEVVKAPSPSKIQRKTKDKKVKKPG